MINLLSVYRRLLITDQKRNVIALTAILGMLMLFIRASISGMLVTKVTSSPWKESMPIYGIMYLFYGGEVVVSRVVLKHLELYSNFLWKLITHLALLK